MYNSLGARYGSNSFLVCLICLFGVYNPIVAQEKNHTMWKVDAIRMNDNEVMIRFDVMIDSGWHLYSAVNNVDQLKSIFFFEKKEGYNLVGAVNEDASYIERYVEVFGQRLRLYERFASFSQRIKVVGNSQLVKGSVRFVLGSKDGLTTVQGLSFSVSANTAIKQISKASIANQ